MRRQLTFLIGLFIVVGLLSFGCTRYATTQQLQELDDTQAAALAAEKTLKEKTKEKAEWQQKVAKKEAELDAKKKEKEQVDKNLGK